jgi:carboxymethylenebutenolidase
MLIEETHKDVPTKAGGNGSMRTCSSSIHPSIGPQLNLQGIFLFHPTIPNYPNARFPGVVVFSEIYQGKLLPLFQDLKIQADG